MKNRPIFIKVKDYVLSHSLTIDQVRSVTPNQVKDLLTLTADEYVEYRTYEASIKKLIIAYLEDQARIAELQELKTIAAAWLLEHFPDAEWQRDKDVVTIYLKGNPDGE